MTEYKVLEQIAELMDQMDADQHERVIAWLGTREQQRRREHHSPDAGGYGADIEHQPDPGRARCREIALRS